MIKDFWTEEELDNADNERITADEFGKNLDQREFSEEYVDMNLMYSDST